jgi:hypothetical protein
MIGSKRVVVPWVPVLGQDHVAEGSGNAVNHRHNILATWYRKCPTVAEVILHIDYQQNVAVNQFHSHVSSFCVPATGFTSPYPIFI